MEQKQFAVIGGDKRSICLADRLKADGQRVRLFGFSNFPERVLEEEKSLYEAVTGADYIIGPVPCSHNGKSLNAAFYEAEIPLDDLFRLIRPGQTVIAGYVKEEVLRLAQRYDLRILDMLKREELLILNAIPTAEGAIKIAIEETDFTLHGTAVGVLGYGRVGRALARMLKGIGARVTAIVDTDEGAAQALSDGIQAVRFAHMLPLLPELGVLFNTVPKVLLDKTNLRYMQKESLLMDLASPPYGIDFESTKALGLKALYTNSLPGKVAPKTTANYMAETIYHMIEEEGGKADEA